MFYWLREELNKMRRFSHHFWENLIRTQSLLKVQMSNHQWYQSLHLIKWMKLANYCLQTEMQTVSRILIVCSLAKANWCITKCILRDLLKLFWLKKGVLHETEVNTQSLAPEMFVNFVLLESYTWQHRALSNDFVWGNVVVARASVQCGDDLTKLLCSHEGLSVPHNFISYFWTKTK